MAWWTDLAGALGLPAGAAVLAASIVVLADRAEQEARPEALKKISDALKRSSWTAAFRPNAAVKAIFDITFSPKHLSWKCLWRSLISSLIFSLALGTLYWERTGKNPLYRTDAFYPSLSYLYAAVVFLLSSLADYIALYKTRMIVEYVSSTRSGALVAFHVVLDALLSLTISVLLPVMLVAPVAFFLLDDRSAFWHNLLEDLRDQWKPLFAALTLSETPVIFRGIMMASTLFTSVWSLLVLLSVVALKLVLPLESVRKFMVWFFPVESHPLKSLGIMAAVLIFLAALLFKWV